MYEVALPGEFGPALLAVFAALGAGGAVTSSVFHLRVTDDQGIPAITAMLQARGLEILEIRRVPARVSPARDEAPGARIGHARVD